MRLSESQEAPGDRERCARTGFIKLGPIIGILPEDPGALESHRQLARFRRVAVHLSKCDCEAEVALLCVTSLQDECTRTVEHRVVGRDGQALPLRVVDHDRRIVDILPRSVHLTPNSIRAAREACRPRRFRQSSNSPIAAGHLDAVGDRSCERAALGKSLHVLGGGEDDWLQPFVAREFLKHSIRCG